MTEAELARLIVSEGLSELEAAIRILWRVQRIEGRSEATFFELTDFFGRHAISHPNKSRLVKRLKLDRRVLKGSGADTLRLRASAIALLDAELTATCPPPSPASPFVAALDAHAAKLQGDQTRSFVLEAVHCIRNGTPRAAIIMSWCGAVSVLQEHVFSHHLREFNEDAVQNGLLKSPAKSLDDLRDISKESHFLESLGRISVIDDAAKRSLKRCLGRRNDVGHPSSVRLSEAAVADHVETLLLNVFDRFATT